MQIFRVIFNILIHTSSQVVFIDNTRTNLQGNNIKLHLYRKIIIGCKAEEEREQTGMNNYDNKVGNV